MRKKVLVGVCKCKKKLKKEKKGKTRPDLCNGEIAGEKTTLAASEACDVDAPGPWRGVH